MVALPDLGMAEGAYREYSPSDTVIDTDEMDCKPDLIPTSSQLTIMTVCSFVDTEYSNYRKDDVESGGTTKIESLFNAGKSVEPVKSLPNDGPTSNIVKEKWHSITLQVFIPFMLAGIGTIGAGIVLGNVKNYDVFNDVQALYVLVPALLGLKGNLDMCLASRLSTQANLGNMKSRKEVIKMIIGNIALVQVQAIVAANLVSIFAVCLSALLHGPFIVSDALLLAASSVMTATLSCFTLDFLLIAVIFISQKMKLNPDNVATPLAASVGDVVSLMVLSTFATVLYKIHESNTIILVVIIAVYIGIILPFWVFIVLKNEYTRSILTTGWTPVLTALVISGSGGLVLDTAVGQFNGYQVFQPIINGIGGNLVSVQASRIATMLHQTSLRGVIPPHTKQFVAPWTALFHGVLPAKTARILIAMSIPGQVLYVFIADIIYNDGVCTLSPVFILSYISVGLIQIMTLLYIAHIMTHTMWVFNIDPDNSAIPYLTSLGDLIGSSLLLLAFVFMRSINQEYAPIQQA
ncbi:hypothetical protein WA026_010354 [Henosepilachna vigintioctopunctata]|uniref:SLC41A/MgtE integral membrane domain-containing protein n=1 Tax=Henosepilachna vigintioctopunctata TaxID=420089 RepID=A0AAW1VB65_9CUCU